MDVMATSKKKKSIFWAAIPAIPTVLYLPAFRYALDYAYLSFMVFDSPRMTMTLGYTYIALFFTIPLSIPVFVYLMWRRYFREKYQMAAVYALGPVFTTLIALGLISNLDSLFLFP